MTLSMGDHLVIKRKGLIYTEDSGEAYHEYEVSDQVQYVTNTNTQETFCVVKLKVIK